MSHHIPVDASKQKEGRGRIEPSLVGIFAVRFFFISLALVTIEYSLEQIYENSTVARHFAGASIRKRKYIAMK